MDSYNQAQYASQARQFTPGLAPEPNFVPQGFEQGQQPNAFGPYAGIFSDQNAQLGAAVGRNALNYGRDYVSRHVSLSIGFCAYILTCLDPAGHVGVCAEVLLPGVEHLRSCQTGPGAVSLEAQALDAKGAAG